MTEGLVENKIRAKLLDLGNGTSIWRVHLDWLREMEENARVMDPDRFERLVGNVRKDARLESLPLVTPNPDRTEEFLIISGHHRTRAARSAGVMEIVVLCLDQALSKDLPDQRIQVDEVKFDIDFEVVNVVFLSHQKKTFDQAIELLAGQGDIDVEALPAFAPFKEAVAKTSQQYNVRNVAGILAKMAQIVLEHAVEAEAAGEGGEPGRAAGQ
jgi:hypothetical protein